METLAFFFWVPKSLAGRFPMKDLGAARSMLGIQSIHDKGRGTLSLKQAGFIRDILATYNMQDCRSVSTPMEQRLKLETLVKTPPECQKLPYHEAVGKLLWVAMGTHPNIAFAVNYLSRFVTGTTRHTGRHLNEFFDTSKALSKMESPTRVMVNSHWSSEDMVLQLGVNYLLSLLF